MMASGEGSGADGVGARADTDGVGANANADGGGARAGADGGAAGWDTGGTAAHSAPHALERARDGLGRYLALLEALVAQESPSGDEVRCRLLADFLAAEMEARGGRVQRHSAPGAGEHLSGRFAGADRDAAPLLVVGHLDTVHAVGTLERCPFRVEGERVYGPGVYDMKAGLAMTLEALSLMAALGETPPTDVVFLVTCDEEVGSASSRWLIEVEAAGARAALVVEPCVAGGDIKTSRKGVGWYRLEVHGQAAHAGVEPGKGASAVHELARMVPRVLALADTEAGTTINVGVMGGGTRANVVADHALAELDVRFWTPEEATRVDHALRALAPEDPRCRLTLGGGIDRAPLERTPASEALYRIAHEEGERLGLSLGSGGTGGASDGNLTSAAGCPTLDGLGPDGGGAHSLDEHVLVADIAPRVALMRALLLRV